MKVSLLVVRVEEDCFEKYGKFTASKIKATQTNDAKEEEEEHKPDRRSNGKTRSRQKQV